MGDIELLSVVEVCEALKIDVAGLMRLLAVGRFPLGVELEPGDIRWQRPAVEGWIRSLKAEAEMRRAATDIAAMDLGDGNGSDVGL